tara:strand:- start:9423 stop:9698 length:276 start_codon:yes stop_codon:yes gene_type:complete
MLIDFAKIIIIFAKIGSIFENIIVDIDIGIIVKIVDVIDVFVFFRCRFGNSGFLDLGYPVRRFAFRADNRGPVQVVILGTTSEAVTFLTAC